MSGLVVNDKKPYMEVRKLLLGETSSTGVSWATHMAFHFTGSECLPSKSVGTIKKKVNVFLPKISESLLSIPVVLWTAFLVE
ncbi:hypothetical protein CPB83DRAFT_851977 [Crepidotus variabilis]|uniref:Uncharacterized protein n=1 Tax=Crepidotus variabilis TaxID=179855 RepID=A0A9P6EIF1_9AGAR|nr:hypothetical protein CPB83DRAFT_851977 [Crepidotus variabilis]